MASGIMDIRLFLADGIKVGLGTDVAGGHSASMVSVFLICSCSHVNSNAGIFTVAVGLYSPDVGGVSCNWL